MTTELQDQFRLAWENASGGDFASRMARQSLMASATQIPELAETLLQLRLRFQAELDLHLDGSSVEDHQADAGKFADFVKGIAEAVKEVTKYATGRQRLAGGLMIAAPSAGSVRLVMRASAPEELDGAIRDARTETANSVSLGRVADLLGRAGQEADSDDSVLAGLLSQLPPRARPGIRRTAQAVATSHWTVSGELRRPAAQPLEIQLGEAGANRLLRLLAERVSATDTVTLSGIVDGQRRSIGAMWFIPTGLEPIEAAVGDPALLDSVAEFAAESASVSATFEVVSTYPVSDRESVRRSHVLVNITDLPPVGLPQS